MKAKGPIVVIDDDPDDLYLYRNAFKKLNLENQLLVFDNPLEALTFFRETTIPPFIIFCDINMPLMSGLELREAMCTTLPECKKNAPFIFMSTSVSASDIERASLFCSHGFFQKELSYERHVTRLRNIIDYWSTCLHPECIAAW